MSNKLVVTPSVAGSGRGLMTASRTQDGEPLIQIPRKLIFTVEASMAESACEEPLRRQAQKIGMTVDDAAYLGILLACERLRGSDSMWSIYIDTIPDIAPGPMYAKFRTYNLFRHRCFRKHLHHHNCCQEMAPKRVG